MKNYLKNAAGTFLPVLLGVYLAIWAGNCNEARKTQAQLTKIQEALHSEITLNKEDIKAGLVYHKNLRDSIELETKGTDENTIEDISPIELFKHWRGTRMGKLRHGAYEAAMASGVLTEMEIEELTQISNLYIQQENYDRLGIHYLGRVGNIGSESSTLDGFLFMNSFCLDAIYAEEDLLKAMEEVLGE